MNIIEIEGTSVVEEDSENELLKQIQCELNLDNETNITDIWSIMSPLTYYVALNDDAPIGVLTLVGCDELPEIYKIYVCKSSRQQNVGMKLFDHVERKLTQSGITEVFVEIIDGFPFWKKLLKNRNIEDLCDGKYVIKLN
ncbi:GNAT family N-acetyltransferase [Vibrio fluvialis]|nr:GNAT family N-acetyltransferase [Vibrio fluvialis]